MSFRQEKKDWVTHAWLKTTMAVGSSLRVSIVDRAVTPKP